MDLAISKTPAKTPPRKTHDEQLLGYFFILPTLLLIGMIIIYPLGQAVYLSLTDSSFIKPQLEFVGLEHYFKMFQDPTFWQVVRNSVSMRAAFSISTDSRTAASQGRAGTPIALEYSSSVKGAFTSMAT